jgi:cytidylate kinase
MARCPSFGVLVSKNRWVASLVVIAGPPGAGKSTVAGLVARRFPLSALVEGDAFFAFLDEGAISPWLPEAHAQNEIVVRAAAAATGRFAASGYLTVYDGVIGPWFLPTFVEATGLDALHCVVLLPTVECCLERVSTREDHDFRDESATRKMHGEFARAKIAPRHLFTDQTEDSEMVAAKVLERLENGELVYEPKA